MRLAVDVMPLLGPGTGVATFTRGLVTELATRDDVELIAYALSFTGRSAIAGAVPAGTRVVRRPMAAGPLLALWGRTDRPAIEVWTGRVDAVHGTNFVVPPARTKDTVQVASVHDLTSVRYPHLCAPASLRYPALVKRAIGRGAIVHTDAEVIRQEVIELLGAPPERVVAVHPGIEVPTRTDAAPPVEPPYVLALGAIEPRKNLTTLVDAFAHVTAELRLVIAGPDAWGATAVNERIAASPKRDRIVRLGYIDDTRRDALLQHASVFVYPSVYEGFGFPPLEAMAAGVPVVASTAGSLPEVLGEGALLVDPTDADALAAAIDEAAGEPVSLIEAGHRNVERFTWARCVDRLLEVYAA